jgi:general secretion pathway protein C
MKTRLAPSWSLRLITLAVWLVAALCVAYWAFKFVSVKPVNANMAASTPAIVVDSAAVAKLLGAIDNVAEKQTIVPASSNYALFGLAMEKSGMGVALIATDGKPAKPYRVGSKVADGWVLKSISRTDVILAASMDAVDGMKLDLPIRQPATSMVAPASVRNQMPAPPMQPQISSATSFIPGAGAAPAAGMAAAMANAANPTAGLTPAQIDAMAQRPVSRFAPGAAGAAGQPDQGTQARIPLKPPASFAPAASDGASR